MSSSAEASKKDRALICPATDRAKGSHSLACLTEETRLRLEEGLRDAGLRAALLVLGQSRPIAAPPMQAPPQSPPRQQPTHARRPTTDRGDAPAFFTKEALLRLEEGLRAQREQQEGKRFSEPASRPSIPDDLSIPDFLRRDKRPTSGSTV